MITHRQRPLPSFLSVCGLKPLEMKDRDEKWADVPTCLWCLADRDRSAWPFIDPMNYVKYSLALSETVTLAEALAILNGAT